ncbi:hotdog fold thioesterase [Pseudoclavibacter chungangensis]|uniref:Hotdog fold thioesterase n=1 Tax=Pseudoclavibacter chungangensis TaxID=587635 RepID=A0A7J5BZR8_9MICO|nr:hotdog fold thioesterase [Pseudoclavibacter chungangensis]KAB1660149.1 hotdog fold thioesterase [Pseudoclavibacter chungangensis]NYJ66741.1 acyl-CoA thioesterase [Pseudoclavibacter chungangensis]
MVSGPRPLREASPTTSDPVGAQHRVLDGDRSAEWMGTHIVRAERGHAEIRMRVRPEMLNGFGTVQGGFVFAFADTAFAIACNDPDETGSITVAQGVDVNFLRPAYEGQTLTARAHAVHEGRSGVYDIEVFAQGDDDEDATPIAIIRGRSRTVPDRR